MHNNNLIDIVKENFVSFCLSQQDEGDGISGIYSVLFFPRMLLLLCSWSWKQC